MSEYPILFKPEMIRAILAGTKTQTRRLGARWAKVNPGDLLWVREGFGFIPDTDGGPIYKTDGPHDGVRSWKSPLFMLRRLARITLDVVEVRAQPLQDISEEDARAEGVEPGLSCEFTAASVFAWLWDSINGKRAPWGSNPMVYAITFRRVEA